MCTCCETFVSLVGLGSILFAITIDRPELNKAYQNAVHISNGGEVTKTASSEEEPRAVIAGDASPSGIAGWE